MLNSGQIAFGTNIVPGNLQSDRVFTANFRYEDTTPPYITPTTVDSITHESSRVRWNTDEIATSRVDYGTSPNLTTYSTRQDSSLKTSHSIQLPNLSPDTTYYYRVISEDSNGNRAQRPEYAPYPSFVTDSEPVQQWQFIIGVYDG